MTPERVAQLADIEPREVLLARMASSIKAPLRNLAGLVAALPRGLATAIQQHIDKSEEGDPPQELSGQEVGEVTAADSASPVAEADTTDKDDPDIEDGEFVEDGNVAVPEVEADEEIIDDDEAAGQAEEE